MGSRQVDLENYQLTINTVGSIKRLSFAFSFRQPAQMSYFSLLFVTVWLVAVINGQTDPTEDQQFEDLVKHHGKKFESEDHKRSARQNFGKSLAFVRSHKQKIQQGGFDQPTFDVDINEFSIMSEQEHKSRRGTKVPANNNRKLSQPSNRAKRQTACSTAAVDWTSKFGPVRNQGSCGSCWAFASIGVVEALVNIKYNVSADLSEQALVDCDTSNYGCNGGWPMTAWSQYTAANKGMSETAYPYKAVNGTCKYATTSALPYLSGAGSWTTPTDLTALESDMIAALAKGPIAVALYASLDSFSYYKSGVYYDVACPSAFGATIDHAVILVGYGIDSVTNTPYWKIRNSWGSGWGESGYMRIRRGSNHCGVEYWGQKVAVL